MTHTIEMLNPSVLVAYRNNSRTHSKEQIVQIENSIKEFGFTNPVLLDDNNEIIAGHGRVLASKKMGIKEVPCLRLSHLSEKQKKAYVIADNQLATNAGWDESILALEIGELSDDDFDISLLGFSDVELNGFLLKEFEGLTDEDEVPEPPVDPVTKLGDIWQLGNHRLVCGDASQTTDVEKLMEGQYPDLICTDPPYGMNAVSKSGVLSKTYKNDILGDNDNSIAKDAFILIHNLYPQAKQIWWGANYYSSVLPDSECWLVWDKNNGQSDQTDCELAWANFRSVVRQFTQASEKRNRSHPTQKPVSLIEWIIKRFKIDSKTIADFFGGSGSTLIGAEKHKMNCYMMELDPKYCDVIIKRWENFTGGKGELINE